MIENELKYLPIMNKGKVIGIVRDIDILSKVVKTNFGSELVVNYLTRACCQLSDQRPLCPLSYRHCCQGIKSLQTK